MPPRLALRHVVEVGHDSFATAEFTDMLRAYGVTPVLSADGGFPQIVEPAAPLVYARIMGTVEAEPAGYAGKDLDLWAERAKIWAAGGQVKGVGPGARKGRPREVFLYIISGFKACNPQAAMALIDRLG